MITEKIERVNYPITPSQETIKEFFSNSIFEYEQGNYGTLKEFRDIIWIDENKNRKILFIVNKDYSKSDEINSLEKLRIRMKEMFDRENVLYDGIEEYCYYFFNYKFLD